MPNLVRRNPLCSRIIDIIIGELYEYEGSYFPALWSWMLGKDEDNG